MLPKDLHSALVRITAQSGDLPWGSGFICHRLDDGVLIVTCRHVVDDIVEAAGAGSEPKVWIDGLYEARPVFYPPESIDLDLAVLKCTAKELRDRNPLPLGQPINVGKARIISYQSLLAKIRERTRRRLTLSITHC